MPKLFLLSIIIALIALPARAARAADPRLGLRKAVIHVSAYFAFYLVGLLLVYGKSGPVHAVYMLFIVLAYRYFPPLQIKQQ